MPKWLGRCPECGTWGTVDEVAVTQRGRAGAVCARCVPAAPAVPITAIDPDRTRHLPTGVERARPGARRRGGPRLGDPAGGDPGVGKSTLLLEVAHRWAADGAPRAVHLRRGVGRPDPDARGADRVHADAGSTWPPRSDLQTRAGPHRRGQPRPRDRRLGADHGAGDVDGVAGGVTQVRAVTAALTAAAKRAGVAMVLVGHVTKDGAIAGPRSLEHLVDVVLHFEGDRTPRCGWSAAVKNRFGAADEVGCFVLHDNGIEGVADPSGCSSISARAGARHGGHRHPRRQASADRRGAGAARRRPAASRGAPSAGWTSPRVAMITAVLRNARRADRSARSTSTCPPSAACGSPTRPPTSRWRSAMASASRTCRCPPRPVVIGEVGLAGDLRRVSGHGPPAGRGRPAGLHRAVVPAGCGPVPQGLRAIESRHHRRRVALDARPSRTSPSRRRRRATAGQGDGPDAVGQ